MNINVNSLKRQLKNLREPKSGSDYMHIQIIERTEELKFIEDYYEVDNILKESPARQIQLQSVKYCKHGNCWYEWEMVF